MTIKQLELVKNLRHELLRNGYPKIYPVDIETLEAVECDILEVLEKLGEYPILKCGKQGLFFKNCELVIRVE
jgi:hypothetical protein